MSQAIKNLALRLVEWAQNEEMVNMGFTEHGLDCLKAAEELERMRGMTKEEYESDVGA